MARESRQCVSQSPMCKQTSHNVSLQPVVEVAVHRLFGVHACKELSHVVVTKFAFRSFIEGSRNTVKDLVLQNRGESCAPSLAQSRRDRNRCGADADAVFSDFSLRVSRRASEIQLVGVAKFMCKASLEVRGIILEGLFESSSAFDFVMVPEGVLECPVMMQFEQFNSWYSIVFPDQQIFNRIQQASLRDLSCSCSKSNFNIISA